VEAILSDDAQVREVLQEAQPETEMFGGLPNFNDPDAYPRPDQQEEAKPAAQPKPKRKKIEDFGEYIPGARKEKAAKFAGSLEEPIDTENGSPSMSDYFPQPDYAALAANGVPMRTLGALAHVRASIRPNPGRDAYHAFWDYVADLRRARENAVALLEGNLEPEKAFDRYRDPEPSLWLDYAETIKDPDDLKRFAKWRLKASYTWKDREKVINGYFLESRTDTSWVRHDMSDTREEFYEKLNARLEKWKAEAKGGRKRKDAELQVAGFRRWPGYAIWFKLPTGGWQVWKKFKQSAEAREYLKENRQEILDEIDADAIAKFPEVHLPGQLRQSVTAIPPTLSAVRVTITQHVGVDSISQKLWVASKLAG